MYEKIKCSQCEGTGIRYMLFVPINCPSCNGMGYIERPKPNSSKYNK